MSHLSEVLATQIRLEENVTKKFEELQQQIKQAGSSKDTVAKIAEELRTFRELVFNILGLLRQQVQECCRQVDDLETRSRRKALLITGCAEKEKEDCTRIVLDILCNKLGLQDVSPSSIKVCHRLGSVNKQHPRPILVRFTNIATKLAAWQSKVKLKGSSIAVKEFLTRVRQSVFTKARLHFGMRSVWTQSGIIVVRGSDGNNHKIVSDEELASLVVKYPKPPIVSSSAAKGRSNEQDR